ncbi:vWA domain-containing protein [Treponema sp. HNW]|uniref:vWA domain-containing protein n=1 Tax=Treponema sp. HNW TaxID=3116654 RepID=UPI003D0A1157
MRPYGISIAILFFCASFYGVFSQSPGGHEPLKIRSPDMRLERSEDGWHLYIKQKEGIASVLLTETTKDPEGKADSYAYRAETFNAVNGNEKRILNGAFLTSEFAKYGIIDSTPEADGQFVSAFHLYIPKKLVYGYPWARNGKVEVKRGTFINIRTFEKPYGDYSGAYADNPFMFDFKSPVKPVTERPPETTEAEEPLPEKPEEEKEPEILTDEYSPHAAAAFTDIASGILTYSRGPSSIVEDVLQSVRKLDKGRACDLVFAIDATGSMWDDIEKLQKELVPALTSELQDRAPVRLGLLFYRDYTDNFRFRGLPVQFNDFTQESAVFFKKLNDMHIPRNSLIGGDTPEAVYEALYASLEFYQWNPAAQRKIILIGDAEPHPSPRGRRGISKKRVEETARKKNITIDCIIIPDGRAGSR